MLLRMSRGGSRLGDPSSFSDFTFSYLLGSVASSCENSSSMTSQSVRVWSVLFYLSLEMKEADMLLFLAMTFGELTLGSSCSRLSMIEAESIPNKFKVSLCRFRETLYFFLRSSCSRFNFYWSFFCFLTFDSEALNFWRSSWYWVSSLLRKSVCSCFFISTWSSSHWISSTLSYNYFDKFLILWFALYNSSSSFLFIDFNSIF